MMTTEAKTKKQCNTPQTVTELLSTLKAKAIGIPADVESLLATALKVSHFNTTSELFEVATGEDGCDEFDVKYEIPSNCNNAGNTSHTGDSTACFTEYTEATVHRVENGLSVNYPETYMRRRDPNTMLIADNLPTDKERFSDKYGYDFSILREETFKWLQENHLATFLYYAGVYPMGAGGIAIAPINAGFFSLSLALLQKMIPLDNIPEGFKIESIIYVAPPFRHTHFKGKQQVVHVRTETLHEVYSYNLYPGPSAKKGLYSVLLDKGEREGWITAHCSTVQVISPYDNITTFMHEGASGGGKSEMNQHIIREPNGEVLLGTNLISGERRLLQIPLFSTFQPVTDDMALCHPSIQKDDGKLRLVDAENAWFIRVDGIKQYGDDPFLEKLTINPKEPALFLSLKTKPGCTALVWDHIEDAPGKRCPNPRVVLPRSSVPGIVYNPVAIDVRSFGVRTPPFSSDKPSYGIIGLFHVLPPALAWLWRLVSPRGHDNPSIVDSETMGSEGVGSFWPFATGKKVTYANILLEQIKSFPRVRYTLTPNQHIGVWKVGFKPQLLMREYLTRRGNATLRSDQYQPARCPALGYELNYLTIEGAKIPSRFLKVYRQSEVREDGYDAGAEILMAFFREQLKSYLQPELAPLGKEIINAFLSNCPVETYHTLMDSQRVK